MAGNPNYHCWKCGQSDHLSCVAFKRTYERSEHRKRRACIIFQSLGGSPVDWEYNPEIFGIPQIDNIDHETLLLFTSHPGGGGEVGYLGPAIFAGYVPLASQNPYPIIVYSLANY